MSDEERSQNSVSRRSMLKRIGVVGAIAWSTPVISSMTTPAYAATSAPCAHGYTCNGELLSCGEDCNCFSTEGGPACTGGANRLCDEFQTCPPGAACPSGTVCVIDSCCATPVCLPLCGTARRSSATRGGSGMTPAGFRQ